MMSKVNSLFLNVYRLKSNSIFLYLYMYLLSLFHPYVKPITYQKARVISKLARHSLENVILSGTGCLILVKSDFVYKFPLSELTSVALNVELVNYTNINKIASLKITGYILEKEVDMGVEFFKMERLQSTSICEANKAKVGVLQQFDSLISEVGNLFSNEKHLIGFNKLREYCDVIESKILAIAACKLKNESILMTPMHGDLTPSNIMKKENKFFLIDLDRFDMKGFSFIDNIHYFVERGAKCLQVNSYSYIDTYMDDIIESSSKLLLLSYLFYRVGAETRDGIELDAIYYRKVIELIKKIIDVKL